MTIHEKPRLDKHEDTCKFNKRMQCDKGPLFLHFFRAPTDSETIRYNNERLAFVTAFDPL